MSERRLLALVGAVVFVDTTFYAVIAPLLPGFAHSLHLSRLSAGILTASYAAGTLAGSLPGGVLAARAGPRLAVCTGLALLACSTVAFAWLTAAAPLDLARFVEGVGGACSWSGAVAWIVAAGPRERRGALLGKTIAAATGGSLVGPAIGAIAAAVGRPALFTGFAVIVVGLIAITRGVPAPERQPEREADSASLLRALRRPSVARAIWLMTLPAIIAGMVSLLGPLRLHRFGAAAAEVGATFLVGAAVEVVVSPAVGSLSDRRGRLLPLRAGLLATGTALACFTLPSSVLVLAALIVAVDGTLGVFWTPAMAMLSDVGDALGLDQGLAAALMNLAWAAGQIIGAAGGGALAKLGGDGLPTLTTTALCLATVLALAAAPRLASRSAAR